MTNINSVDKNLEDVYVPSNFLDIIYIGRCNGKDLPWLKSCSLHFGKITDVNIWNRALTIDEMLGWTNCRYHRIMLLSLGLFQISGVRTNSL